jgi:indolepyruvate ferredoxin oxidoreductase beta subunit
MSDLQASSAPFPSPVSSASGALAPAARATTIAILAMGGEGGGVLADWIVDLAEHAGYYAQTTSVPGVAQRTGATIYYLEIFPEAAVADAGRAPVLSLMPVPGEVDVVIASELMEAGRAVQRGLVTADRTTLIASTNRVYSMTERTAMADGRVDSTALVQAGAASAKRFVQGDFARIAEESRSVISAALFGALAATEVLPFTREQCEEAIRRGGVGVPSSLAAFGAGFAEARKGASVPTPTVTASAPEAEERVGPRLYALASRVHRAFPTVAHDILFAAITRLADYQDVQYATEYLDRLEPIREADADHGHGTFALLREAGRHLALWMAYEDAIRVADLKIRRTRFERVEREARATGAQVVRINDFVHPRVEELSDILPAGVGRWLLRSAWARSTVDRLTRRGKVVPTTSLHGFLQLYIIAALRPGRRRSLRFGREQEAIDAWLSQLPALAEREYDLALAIAACPRLLKGYGDTHARGLKNFDAVMATVPALRGRADAAARLRALQDAALADDTGEKLAKALSDLPPGT